MTRQLPGQITEMFWPRTFSDFPKLSVTALFWWAKGRRPSGPPKEYPDLFRSLPICSVFFRFVPMCFQSKPEQIRETPFCRPLLQIPTSLRGRKTRWTFLGYFLIFPFWGQGKGPSMDQCRPQGKLLTNFRAMAPKSL